MIKNVVFLCNHDLCRMQFMDSSRNFSMSLLHFSATYIFYSYLKLCWLLLYGSSKRAKTPRNNFLTVIKGSLLAYVNTHQRVVKDYILQHL
jgi:hypothetical protein